MARMGIVIRSLSLIILMVAALTPALAQEASDGSASVDSAAEDQAPSFPAGLDNPGIPVEELTLRVIPLTVDQAKALADAWLGIVQQKTEAVVEQQIRVNELPEDQAGDARDRLTELTADRGEAFAKYTAVVDNFQKKGGDQAAVDTFRAYRAAIIVDEKQNADWRTLANQALAWTTSKDGGIKLGIRVGTIVASFLGLLIVARIIKGFANRGFRRVPNLSKLLQAFLAMVVYWLTMAFGLMVVLSALGVDITPIFALVGGASFILAFAFQDTLSNLASGLMIMFNHPFDEGDYVTVAGTGGTVKSVSVVSTTVATPDNQIIVIPNSKVWGDVITNVTASTTRRVDLVFGISYDDSIADAQAILERVVTAHPLVLSDPEPVIRVNELGASSVDFICRPWAKTSDYWTVYWDLQQQVKEAFDAAGITIPYPQTDMHLHVTNGASVPALPAAVAATVAGAGTQSPSVSDYRSGDEGHDAPGADDRGGA